MSRGIPSPTARPTITPERSSPVDTHAQRYLHSRVCVLHAQFTPPVFPGREQGCCETSFRVFKHQQVRNYTDYGLLINRSNRLGARLTSKSNSANLAVWYKTKKS